MCSFFLLESLRKDNEWFIAGTPVAHRPLVCMVWEYIRTQISCSYRPSYVENAFAPSPEHRMGCLWPALPGFFSYSFSLCPFQGVVWLCSSPEGLSQEIHPHQEPCGLRAAEACNAHCGCYRTSVALSKSLQVVPYIQILKYTLTANPIDWPYTLCSVVSGQKEEGQKGYRTGEEKPWWIGVEGIKREECLGQMFPHAVKPFRSTGPHTSPVGWSRHFILGNTVISLRAEKVAWSLQSSSGLVPK